MFDEQQPKKYHSAIVDVTDRCNLRCRHCFYFREERYSQDMAGEEFLDGLRALRDRHDILSMGWCGGEPLYRREVLEEGLSLFQLNTIYTNGTLPLPRVSNAIVAVSIDGPPEVHDHIRGRGQFERAMENVGKAELPFVLFLATLNRINAPHVREMVSLLSKNPNTGLGILFFTPLTEYEPVPGYRYTDEQAHGLELPPEERDAVLEELLLLREEYGGYIFNPARSLELMMSDTAALCTRSCNMPQRTLTLDLQLNRKLPCVLGRSVDCSKCGCIFPFLQQAKKEGDPESVALRF